MIDWKTIKDLHVISKLEHIIGDWFGAELVYVNEHGKVQNTINQKDYEYKNHFFKVHMHLPHGYEYLNSDIEKAYHHFEEGNFEPWASESFFPGVRFVASPVVYEGEFLGFVMGYPFVKDDFTTEDKEHLIKKIVECGATAEDAGSAIDHLKRLSPEEKDYLKELISLVSEEVSTFHEEISKREDRIKDLNSELGSKYRYHNMIGKSKAMQTTYHLLDKISKSESHDSYSR
jgi:two-component system response regulator HupR/HoxA